jgi:hypothetical protein
MGAGRSAADNAPVRSIRLLCCLVVVLVVVVGGCSGDRDASSSDDRDGAEPSVWRAPADPRAAARAAGLELDRKEHLATHRHAHIDVFVDGRRVEVPPAIGIDISDPGVRHFEDPVSYGGIEECDNPCISPLHTHDASGIIHTESTDDALLTLGQFFTAWGVELDESCVADYCRPDTDIAVYVHGAKYSGNPADIPLTDGLVIAVVIGSPPEEIPSDADFSQA